MRTFSFLVFISEFEGKLYLCPPNIFSPLPPSYSRYSGAGPACIRHYLFILGIQKKIKSKQTTNKINTSAVYKMNSNTGLLPAAAIGFFCISLQGKTAMGPDTCFRSAVPFLLTLRFQKSDRLFTK